MQIAEILRQALAAVDEAQLPDDLRLAGFESAIALLSPASTPPPQTPPPGQPAAPSVLPQQSLGRLSSISVEFGLADGQAERLFDEHEGELQFVGDVGRFGKTTSAKVLALATVFAAARQAGKYDDGPTSDAVIRREVDRHGLLDPGNYTKHLQPLKAYFNINGSGKSASYKIKYDGRRKAKELSQLILAA